MTWQKVKGHAKDEHIERGEATAETKEGNDWADFYATRGVKQHGGVVTEVGKWLKKRQDQYLNQQYVLFVEIAIDKIVQTRVLNLLPQYPFPYHLQQCLTLFHHN